MLRRGEKLPVPFTLSEQEETIFDALDQTRLPIDEGKEEDERAY
jgi:hypothetical protein